MAASGTGAFLGAMFLLALPRRFRIAWITTALVVIARGNGSASRSSSSGRLRGAVRDRDGVLDVSRELAQRTGPAPAQQSDHEAELAAAGPRQRLAQGEELPVLAIVEPAAPFDEFAAQQHEVGDGSAKACQAKTQENQKDFQVR